MNEPRDNEQTQDRQFAEQAKELFDGSVERLDAATLSRLNKGRHAALDELTGTRPGQHWLRWIPATGVAAAVLVTVMVMRGPDTTDISVNPLTASDFEILMEDESLEMFEDLEFYSWLEASDLDTNGNVG